MKSFDKSYYLLGLAMTAAIVSGCGAPSQGPAESRIMPQGVAFKGLAAHGKSWMKPSTSGDLVYISSYTNVVWIYSYPGGALVGTLTGFNNPSGICSDANGNVWITNSNAATIIEYAHGGTAPIATLNDSGQTPVDCAVDPTTGNLAAADYISNVAVYQNAQGSPSYYSTVGVLEDALWVDYDNVGNLFAASRWHTPVWMKKGNSVFQKFGLKPHIHARHHGLQFDGTYMTLEGADVIYRYSYRQVPRARQAGTIKLNAACCADYWIHDSELAGDDGSSNAYFFNYPAGGNPITTITGLQGAQGIAISVAPSRKQPRQ